MRASKTKIFSSLQRTQKSFTMKMLLIASLLVAAVCGNSIIPPGAEMTQCNPEDVECPEITNRQVNTGYELRTYVATKWVSTACTGPNIEDYDRCSSISFNTLFNYISGQNTDAMKIDMTSPVITKVAHGSGPNCESTFTQSFFVPSALHDSTAAPTGQGVFLEDLSELNVYVIAFDGFADGEDYMSFALQLAENIGDASLYNSDYYYFVGYNSPFEIIDRRNEVWFVAK